MEMIQQCFISGIVLLAFGGALWTMQRRGMLQFRHGTPRRERQLQVIERLQLTPQHSLCLVRMDNRTLLIGTAPSSCHVLDQRHT